MCSIKNLKVVLIDHFRGSGLRAHAFTLPLGRLNYLHLGTLFTSG